MKMMAEIDFPLGDGKRLRRSFGEPAEMLTACCLEEVPETIRKAEDAARRGFIVLGMVAYEAAPAFDAALPALPPMDGLPLAAFAAFDVTTKSSEEAEEKTAKADVGDFRCSAWHAEPSPADFRAQVAAAREAIAAGDYCQTNLSLRFRSQFKGDAAALHSALKKAQPDGFSLFLDWDDWQICSASPELFFDFDPQSRRITARPMKGTAAADEKDGAEKLKASEKDRAENLMIVDLMRNDLSRVCEIGSVKTPRLFEVERLPTALQMTSTIIGKVSAEAGLAEIFAALFPCGSVTGAPKRAAMQAIANSEKSPRGTYCGALGAILPSGRALFNVGIRTALIKNGVAECGIGSGITWHSTPEGEWDECLVKRRFLLRASADFSLLESILLENGEIFLFDRHMDRLQRGASHFGFPLNLGEAKKALADLAAAHPTGRSMARLMLDRNGGVSVENRPLPAAPATAKVVLAARPVDEEDEFLRHKTTNRALYEDLSPKNPDIFDALLFNRRGEITEFTRANVAVELDGKIVTPPLSCGLLGGTMRAHLLDAGWMAEKAIKLEDLPRASRIWFINSVRGKIPVELAQEVEVTTC